MERQSVATFLDGFRSHSDACAYVQKRGYRTERWTYRQVADTAAQFAHELDAREIRKDDRVMIWGENSAEWVATFYGCVLRGIVVVPMDDSGSPDFAERVRDQVDAKLVVCSRQHARQFTRLPTMVLEDLREQVARHPTTDGNRVLLAPEQILEIIFTSGTTAEPKGVVISHGNVLSNTAPLENEIRKYLKYERFVHPVRFLNQLPLSHVFGQFLGLFLPSLMAGTVIFQESHNPSQVIETIHRERVSVLVAVPRMLQSLKDKLERDLEGSGRIQNFRERFRTSEQQHFLRRWWTFRDVRSQFGWKFWAFICGGAALDGETEEFWGRLGYAAIQGYGLTETTSLVSVNHPFRLGKGSIGKVLPGREVKLAHDGEILVRGGGVASGYWRNHRQEDSSGEDGWYRTGDVGELDSDGNLYFKGRKKDVLVTSAGMNIYPEDLEAALRRQPEIRDVAVVGLNRGGNEEACAVLIFRENATRAEEVVKRANQQLAEFQRMQEWFVWPEQDFPRTSTGKPRANVIRDAVQGARQQKREHVSGTSPLTELITKISGRSTTNLRLDANLEDDLHLSSLERVELLSALEDRYQVDLSETRFSSARTVGELEQVLAGKSGPSSPYTYPGWALSWPVRWLRILAYYLLVRPATLVLGWPRIEGRERLRGVKGPVLVISNHIDHVDVGFILTALPAHLRHRLATATGGEALQILRTPAVGRGLIGRAYDLMQWTLAVTLLNLFPLPREAGFMKSFSYAGGCIDRGYSVLVFPEGRHTTDGKLHAFRSGIGLLAKQLRAPVLPMRIDGLFEVKQAGRRYASPGKIRVRIGEPVEFSPDTDPQQIVHELERRVAEA